MRLNLLILSSCIFLSLVGCRRNENHTANYLKNAEPQYEGLVQRENITGALNDMLTLSKEELKAKRYSDYEGNENQWDLPTLIDKHFVPAGRDKLLSENFYDEIKTEEGREIIDDILRRMVSR